MKTLNLIFCLGVFVTSIQAGTPTWSTNALPSAFTARTSSVAFAVGTKAYVGLGTKANPGFADTDYGDFWEYNSLTDTWTQKANFADPGSNPRKNAVGFVLGASGSEKVYVGMGGNYAGNQLKDFWAFNPSSNTWIKQTDFGGSPDYRGVAFAINGKGYVRSGDISSMVNRTSFWEYDPNVGAGGTWTQKTDIGTVGNGVVLSSAAGFSIGSKGYLCTGLSAGNASTPKDFYEYSPTSDTWTKKADFVGVGRFNAVGFASSTKGYICFGYDTNETERNSVWEFDPAAKSGAGDWMKILDYPNIASSTRRSQAIGFAIADNLYVGTGQYSSSYFNDFYVYYPAGAPVLPVELTTINATADVPQEHVDINWQTASEEQSAYFAIERLNKSTNQFEEIGRVKGAGNSAKTLIYKYIDEKPVYGISYYRLRLADIDGKTTYSKTVSVSYKGGAKVKVFPTFTDGYVNIENGDKRIDDVYVWNATGQLMLQSKQTQLDLSDLPGGLYLVQVKTGGETFVQKITKR